jgi:hypothetical protein
MMSLRLVQACWFVVPALASAHHSGVYDEERILEVEGRIVSVVWRNPHVRLSLEIEASSGEQVRWDVEGTSANVLERWGIDRDRLAVGDLVSVRGLQSRAEPTTMLGATLELAGGAKVQLRPDVAARLGLVETAVAGLFPAPAAPAAARGRGIFRVWTPRDRAVGGDLPLTQAAREAASDYDALTDDPALNCVAPGMPGMLSTAYPIEFVDRGDEILMRYEEWDGLRRVYMKPGGGPPVQEPSPNGVSFGRWIGPALEIFTLYIDASYFDRLGTPQGESVTVLERYTPDEVHARLDWQVTVTDPAVFSAPVIRQGHMVFEPGETIRPFDCALRP